jgi:hypothetical protein
VDIAAGDGLTLFAYTAEPGSRSAEALGLLGSWVASERDDASLNSTETI